MIKFNHKAKSFPGSMGMDDKRWNQITEAVKAALLSPEAKTTPQEIEMALKKLGKVNETDLVVLGYVIGAHFASNNSPTQSKELIRAVLLAAMLK